MDETLQLSGPESPIVCGTQLFYVPSPGTENPIGARIDVHLDYDAKVTPAALGKPRIDSSHSERAVTSR